MKNLIVTLIGLAVLVALIFFMMRGTDNTMEPTMNDDVNQEMADTTNDEIDARATGSTMSYLLEDASGETQATITFDDSNSGLATLVVDGTEYDLMQVETASGIRYESADGEVVYTEHQGEAQIEMNGEVTHEDLSPEAASEDDLGAMYDVDAEGNANSDEAEDSTDPAEAEMEM